MGKQKASRKSTLLNNHLILICLAAIGIILILFMLTSHSLHGTTVFANTLSGENIVHGLYKELQIPRIFLESKETPNIVCAIKTALSKHKANF